MSTPSAMPHLQQHSSPAPTSGRMKYADPRSLPSYPSRGLPTDASASAAAALGWANQKKPFANKPTMEHRVSASAARAASIAVEPKSSPHPPYEGRVRRQASRTSAKPQTHNSGTPPPPAADLGNSAATQAFRAQPARPVQYVARNNRTSLVAAQEAVAARPRSHSSPIIRQPARAQPTGTGSGPGDDSTSTSQRWGFTPGSAAPGDSGSALAPANISASMFTSHPFESADAEEKKRADELHASAVAMAQGMFKMQPKLTESFLPEHDDSDDERSIANAAQSDQRLNLHEAAYKMAQDRLAKLHDEHQKNKDFQDYYTPSGINVSAPRRRFTISGRFRDRASSDSDVDSHPGTASNRMSLFSLPSQPKIERDKEREKGRENVLAAARRNVRSQLDDIDQTVADKTGMVPPSRHSAWDSRALSVAQAWVAHAAVERPHEGQRDVGGGRLVAQDDIDAIAAQNVKPLLTEMDERVEMERERQRVLQEEIEAKRIAAEQKKAKDKDVKDNLRMLKAEQKEKDAERQRVLKEEERARKNEEKARKRESKAAAANGADATQAGPRSPSGGSEEQSPPSGSQRYSILRRTTTPPNADDSESREPALSPGKVKSWLKAKLTRNKAAGKKSGDSEQDRSFVGGHGLRTPSGAAGGTATPSSAREVALAGRAGQAQPEGRQPGSEGLDHEEGDCASLGRVVSSGTDDTFEDAMERPLSPTPPPRIVDLGYSRSPARDSRFKEIMD